LGVGGGEQDGGDGGGFADVVGGVAQEGVVVVAEGLGDVAALDIGAVRGGDAEVAGDGFQAMAFHGAVGDVVDEREQIGVDDLPAVEMGFGIGDHSLGGVEARGVGVGPGTVASEGERNAVALGAGFDVGQVELEKVVPGDDVGVALADDLHESFQHGFFVEVLGRPGPVPSPGRRRGRWRGCGLPRGRRLENSRSGAQSVSMSRNRNVRSGRSRSRKEVRPVSSRNCWTGSRRTK
jgi:hypothetical protein